MKIALCFALLLVLGLTTLVQSKPSEGGWQLVGKASPATELPSLVVYLQQNEAGVSELERLLLEELSNPLSPRYGQWLTNEQVMAFTAPARSEQLRAKAFLESTGMSCELLGDLAVLSGTVAQAELLFNVRFFELAHPAKPGQLYVRCLDVPLIPEDLRSVIQMVPSFGRLAEPRSRLHFLDGAAQKASTDPSVNYGVVPETIRQLYNIPEDLRSVIQMVPSFGRLAEPRSRLHFLDGAAQKASTDPSVNYGVVPETIRQLYNIPDTAQVTNPKSSVAVVEFGNSAGVSFTDLTTFQQGTASPADNITSIVGNWAPFDPANGDDGESTLDVQYLLAVAPNLTVNGGSMGFWVVPGWIEDFTTLVQKRQATGQFVPWIFSISYGWAELEACRVAGEGLNCVGKNESEPYVVRTNAELMKIGATGVTIIGLTQDAGAASKWNMACNKNPPVNPSWPGASPWLTALGATQVLGGSVLPGSATSPICNTLTCLDGTTGTEVVCSVATGALITSGGGFSIYAAQPSYQAKAVSSWIEGPGLRPPADLFNPANRGEADIALIGHALQIVLNGEWLAVDGTSASAPIFGGFVTLLNDLRFNAGLPSLGFLNPLIYSMWAAQPSIFHDITIGNNTATEYPHTCTTPGYGAVPGWDPPTGLGCPLYQQMAAYVAALPN